MSNRICWLTVATILISLLVQAQTGEHHFAYFTEDWIEIYNKEQAFYRRTIEELNGKFVVRDYFVGSNQLKKKVVCSGVVPRTVFDGEGVWYYENGNVQQTAMYSQGELVGELRTYYENGDPRSVEETRDKKPVVGQFWSPEGVAQLNAGTGIIREDSPSFAQFNYREVVDSLVIADFSIRYNSADTVFTLTSQKAEYVGGMVQFYKEVSKEMRYPATARRKRIEGRIFVEFVVDEKGSVTALKVIRGIGGGCDEEALRVLAKRNDWTPAYYKGRPVKMRMVLPLTFKLG